MTPPSIDVRPATRRDLCFTLSNARQIDKDEVLASGPRNLTEAGFLTDHLTQTLGGFGYCVWIDGNPEFSFGFTCQSPLMPWLYSGWAWGSDKTPIAMVGVSRWARGGKLLGMLDDLGVRRIEARSIHNHHDAHRWLLWLGFKRETELEEWGRDGTRFVQYAWVRSQFADEGGRRNVFRLKPATASTASAATD